MPIEVVWDNAEKTIVRHIYDGQWTWDEFHAAMVQANSMMSTVSHKVHIILDVSKTGPIPSGAINEINIMRKLVRRPNQGKTILAGTNPFLNLIYDFFTKFTSFSNFAMVPTLEAARTMLSEIKE